MKNRIVLCCTFFIAILYYNHTYCQTAKRQIIVNEDKEVIDNVNREGMSVLIYLDQSFVQKSWEKKIKEYGRIDITRGYSVMKGATIPNICTNCTIYSKVSVSGNAIRVFWSIEELNGYVNANHAKFNEAKLKLQEFARQTYIDDINNQILAAENALSASVKTQEKIIKEGDQIQLNLQKNEQTRLELEDKLKQNAEEKIALQKALEENAARKAQAELDVAKMKQGLDVVKQKLNQY